MKIPPIVFAASALLACTNPVGDTPTTQAGAAENWSRYMERLDGTVNFLKKNLGQQPHGDLVAIAQRAEAAAAGMSKGYGEHELTDIVGFARYARDAEAWFLKIALEARQGHGELAAEAFRTGVAKHCTECHDAETTNGR